MNLKLGRYYGFTIIELVIVIVIIGIVSALSAPRFFKLQTFQERGYHDEVMAAVRYAHKAAMATGCNYKVNVNSSGYEISKDNNSTCSGETFAPISNPATGDPSKYGENTPSGVSIIGNLNFYYNNNGQPYSIPKTEITSVNSISIGSRTIQIEPYTGFIHN